MENQKQPKTEGSGDIWVEPNPIGGPMARQASNVRSPTTAADIVAQAFANLPPSTEAQNALCAGALNNYLNDTARNVACVQKGRAFHALYEEREASCITDPCHYHSVVPIVLDEGSVAERPDLITEKTEMATNIVNSLWIGAEDDKAAIYIQLAAKKAWIMNPDGTTEEVAERPALITAIKERDAFSDALHHIIADTPLPYEDPFERCRAAAAAALGYGIPEPMDLRKYEGLTFGDSLAIIQRTANKALTERDEARQQRDNWMETAAKFHRNQLYYAGIVDEIGVLLGPAAMTNDSGTFTGEVLRAKVVETLKATLPVLVEKIAALDSELAKRPAAVPLGTRPHASDCAVHNAPACPAGPCDCGAMDRPANPFREFPRDTRRMGP